MTLCGALWVSRLAHPRSPAARPSEHWRLVVPGKKKPKKAKGWRQVGGGGKVVQILPREMCTWAMTRPRAAAWMRHLRPRDRKTSSGRLQRFAMQHRFILVDGALVALPLPSLGVSSLDLGRLQTQAAPFLFWCPDFSGARSVRCQDPGCRLVFGMGGGEPKSLAAGRAAMWPASGRFPAIRLPHGLRATAGFVRSTLRPDVRGPCAASRSRWSARACPRRDTEPGSARSAGHARCGQAGHSAR